MIRRLNYTGRVKIPRSRISISLLNDKQGKYFHAKLDFGGLNLSPDAKIYIEPNYKGVYQRFYFGTVAQFKEPDNTFLNELPETELAYFDVSVVDESGTVGLLLGSAKGIPVITDGTPNDRIPLLPVNPADLGNQFWKLSFDSGEEGRPILEINRNLPDPFEMARNDIKFISLVYPVAFRGVLVRLIQQRIEISLRTKMIYHMSTGFGGLWYLDPTLFVSQNFTLNGITKTIHLHTLDELKREFNRSQETFIKYHKNRYPNQDADAWKILEVASMGTLSKLYKNINHHFLKNQQ
ncbi:MAG: Abi family protein [Ferruginibacter sp.]